MRVDEIMIPRSQMVTVKASQEPKEFLGEIMDSAHSRFPVIGDSQDDVIGVLLAKDLLVLRLLAADGFDLRQTLVPILDRLLPDGLPRAWRL